MRQTSTVNALWQDVRLALRKLTRKPGFSVVAVLSLALGIGANTAIFSVVNTVLLRSLSYRDPGRLVRVWETFAFPGGRSRGSVSVPNFHDWQEQNRSFEAIGAYSMASFNLMGDNLPLQVSGASVTPELFPLLGVDPFLGRTIKPDRDTRDDRVVVLSHRLWQSLFGGDPEIVGQTPHIDGEVYTVIGVMPPEFRFPPRSASTQMWTPLDYTERSGNSRGSHWMNTVARLKPGVTLEAAQSDMDAVARRLEEEYPGPQDQRGVMIQVLSESLVARTRPVLLALWGAVGLVLLIACGNVANLLLARATGRERELAVRAALGAGRGRLVQQTLVESLLLALAGGGLGLALGYWSVGYLASLPGTSLPRGQAAAFDYRVLTVCVAASLLAAAVSGLVPAIRASRTNLQAAMMNRSVAPGAARHRDPIRSSLVVAEVALALVVLIGASLVLRSFMSLRSVDPGLETDNVLTLRVPLPDARYDTEEAIRSFYDRLLARVDALPGVQSSGLINVLPIQNWGWNGEFNVYGRPTLPSGQQPFSEYRRVGGEYFETFGIAMVAGRFFDQRDDADSSDVALINQTLARRYWPDESPVGQRIGWEPEAPLKDWVEIVGVVADVKSAGLSAETRGEMYFPFAQATQAEMSLVVRSRVEPADLAAMIRNDVRSIDPEQPIYNVASMNEVVATFLASWRFNAVLLTFFAALALVLAMLGVYGVMSYSVSQRTYEIGLRMALGARRIDVLRLFVRQGLLLTAAGAAAGMVAAAGLTRFLSSQLYGVKATDPATFAAVTLVLLLVAAVACAVPARRASTVEPVTALSYE